ncbi:Histidine kinase [Streptosporangium subroseum]|uniref:histidine kinase n=1 Tax=Streptosporangium subroseum TaxID=106412 RepID=A0A239ID81_9ACTN|nr:histidine kinase [Streptosporangium subroseum]SNS91531.1 Histidine kinase [Streptosporangium subroseum]
MRLHAPRAAWRFLKRPRVQDALLAGLVLLLEGSAMLRSHLGDPRGQIIGGAIAAAGCLALLARRSRPAAVVMVTLALDLAGVAAGVDGPGTTPGVVALYSAGRHAPNRTAWLLAGAGACTYLTGMVLVVPPLPGNQTVPVLGAFIYVGLGQYIRFRGELRQRGQREAAENAVRAERRRIARELHDVVAHHISVITVLMGAARTTVPADPGKAQETLLTAERTARTAMTEMRRLLHVLRAEDGEQPENQAGVGAAALPELVRQAASAGLPARLEVTGEAVALPSVVDHAIYRIVQESLTNTRRHARGARSSVRLTYLPDAVEVEVLDDGLGARAAPGGGFGLVGMAERVALSGGELRTGPRREGGFGVHARFPLPGAASLGAEAQPGA